MSKYDEIKSPHELVREVALHGLSTLQEDICRAQDIFGRTPLEELIQLANNDGRCDGNRNPTPDGNWSVGRDGTQKFFLQIIFSIWHWEDAVRFYNEYVNPILKKNKTELSTITQSYEKLKNDHLELLSAKEAVDKECISLDNQVKMLDIKNTSLEQEIRTQNQVILELKARLFDMLEKGEKQ